MREENVKAKTHTRLKKPAIFKMFHYLKHVANKVELKRKFVKY